MGNIIMEEITNLKNKFLFPVYSIEIESVFELKKLQLPKQYYTMLLLADYSKLNREELSKIAKELIQNGLRYVCAWGKECSMGDMAFDIGNILWQEENCDSLHVMTTWHDESLAEAVWFWLYCARPDDEFLSECCAVVINVASEAETSELNKLLTDKAYLNQLVD